MQNANTVNSQIPPSPFEALQADCQIFLGLTYAGHVVPHVMFLTPPRRSFQFLEEEG